MSNDYEISDLAPVFAAINKAAREIPSLRKGDRNSHGNYNYVSIDDYYEQAGTVVHDNGLTWSIREASSEVAQVGEKAGAGGVVMPVMALKVCYEVDVYHVSGVVLDSMFSTSIIHPLQGAQTAGSAMSYAAKLFLRNAFGIVTGEQDADATDGDAFGMGTPPAAKPAPRPATPAKVPPPDAAGVLVHLGDNPHNAAASDGIGLAFTAKAAIEFIDLCKTVDDLNRYWVDNEAMFKLQQADNPDGYKTVIAAFKARKKVLAK